MDESVRRADLSGRELVVHLFAPLDGPDAAVAADHLAHVWHQCRRGLGMSHEVTGLGLPAALPGDWSAPAPEAPPQAAFAACTRRGSGVFQAIMRRHHDVANLSVVLAPPADAVDEDASWASLDELWTQTTGEPRAAAERALAEPATVRWVESGVAAPGPT
jgi:hypothetical protein